MPVTQFIGVDGGGTNTRAAALDEHGNQLGSGYAAGSNPNNVGYAVAAQNIAKAIAGTGVLLDSQTSVCLGIAGLRNEEEQSQLREELISANSLLKEARLHITHDLAIAHHAAFRGKAGIVLIAGTGSACYGRDDSGKEFRASGRDFVYDDPGSGYAIGIRAIQNDLLPPENERDLIAALAPRVIELAKNGNDSAAAILLEEATQISKLAHKVYSELLESSAHPELALSGKLVTTPSHYRTLVLEALQSSMPGIRIVHTRMEPTLAAADLAKRLVRD